MGLITSDEIERWADKHETEGYFPLLIRKILQNRLNHNCKKFAIPTQGSIWKGGFDGRILVTTDVDFFKKDTIYVFEFGKNKNYKKKFEEDVLKVTKHINTDLNKYVFIFISPRKIELKTREDLIEEAKKKDKKLKQLDDIKIFDSDDIETWLDNDLATTVWLEHQLDKPEILETSEIFFNKWLESTEDIKLNEDIILARKHDHKGSIIDFLNNKTQNIIIKSNSKKESILYFLATIKKLTKEEQEQYLSKIIICDDETKWKEIICYKNIHNNFILIPNFSNIPDGLAFSSSNFKIMIPLGKSENLQRKHQIIQISEIDKIQILELLSKQISREKAYLLLKKANYELFFLQKLCEKKNSPSQIPEWKNEQNAKYLIATAFLVEFSENNEFDKEIIVKLIDEDWDTIRKQLYYISKKENSPINKIGEFWKNNCPEIVVNYYRDFIEEKMISAVCEVSSINLSKIDDKYNKTPEDRFFYFSKSVNKNISENLKRSLPKSLALLSALNEENLINPQYNVQDKINCSIKQIFANSNDWKLWATLEHNIEYLAEASPETFLDIIENTINNKTTIKEIFEQSSGNSLSTQCIQAPILFALERLAWNKQYLSRVCEILLKMHELDEGQSKYDNRPLNTLTDILTPWHLKTNASVEDVKEILNGILERFNIDDIKFDFLNRLVDKQVSSCSSKPEYKKWKIVDNRNISIDEFNEFTKFLFDKIFNMLDNNGKYWSKTLKIVLNSNEENINKFILKINKKNFSEFDDLSLLKIKNSIANIFHYIEIKKDLDNEEVYDKNVIKVLKDIFDNKIKFKNYIYNYLHLYSKENGYNHNLENKNRLEEQLALQDIIKKENIDGLVKFIYLTELKHLVASDLSRIDLSKEEINEIIIKILKDKTNINYDKNIEFLSSFIGALYYNEGFSILSKINIKNEHIKNNLVLLIKNIKIDKNILEWTKAKKIDNDYLKIADSFIIVEKQENFDFILTELLNKNLYFKVFNLIALNLNRFLVKTTIIVDVLNKIDLNSDEFNIKNDTLFHYHLKIIFDVLYADINIDKKILIPIEFKFFYPLQQEFKFPKFIKYEFFNNEQFFIDLIKIFYLSKEKEHAKVSYDILQTFIEYNLNYNNADDKSFLINIYNWVRKIIDLSSKENENILSIVYEKIGERLARTPIDLEDNLFPNKEVRQVLEKFKIEKLQRGFLIGLFNKRGVFFREYHSGGKAERELENQYNEYAKKLENRYPTTASLLRKMASRYNFDSKEMDKREELNDDY